MIYIAMATYNGEKYIKEQINSILNQTYKDWILVISDDCSSDNTLSIVRSFQSTYPEKIKVIKNTTPSKSAGNNFLNLILKLKNECEYLALCDQDDIWFENKLEITLKKMNELEKKYGENTPILIHSDLQVVDENLKTIHKSFFDFQGIDPNRNFLRNLLIQNNITGCTTMVNKSLLDLINHKPREFTMHDCWLGLIACCFGYIDYISSPTMLYRQHSKNQVGAKNSKSIGFLIDKFKKIQVVKNNYKKMFTQATLFLDEYNDMLSTEQKEILNAFIKLQYLNRFSKIVQIIKYKFYKKSFIVTFLQFFII